MGDRHGDPTVSAGRESQEGRQKEKDKKKKRRGREGPPGVKRIASLPDSTGSSLIQYEDGEVTDGLVGCCSFFHSLHSFSLFGSIDGGMYRQTPRRQIILVVRGARRENRTPRVKKSKKKRNPEAGRCDTPEEGGKIEIYDQIIEKSNEITPISDIR
jgi:hypothetical protein